MADVRAENASDTYIPQLICALAEQSASAG